MAFVATNKFVPSCLCAVGSPAPLAKTGEELCTRRKHKVPRLRSAIQRTDDGTPLGM